MSHQPLLAVIVPVYKVEDYLRLCVDSILSQSYSNLRIILVDDGSPDGCGAICDAYAEQDPRVLSVHKENGGLSSARNFGLQYTEGCEYIAFVDSDDSIEPDIYEAAISYLEAHADVDIVGYGINEIRADGKFYCGEKEGRLFTREEALAELVQGFSFKVGPSAWSKVYRASAIGTIRFREGYVYEDNSFSLGSLVRSTLTICCHKGGITICYIEKGLLPLALIRAWLASLIILRICSAVMLMMLLSASMPILWRSTTCGCIGISSMVPSSIKDRRPSIERSLRLSCPISSEPVSVPLSMSSGRVCIA